MMDELGKNIKAERKRQKLSLQELADRAGVSVSFLSQVENGKNDPSITTLKKIATCLGVNASTLLGEDNPVNGMLVKKANRHKLANLGDNLEIEFLAALDPRNIMEVCVHNLGPGGKSGSVPYSHDGQEVFLVLEGNFVLQVDDQMFMMEAGDSFYLNDCSRMHMFTNVSKTDGAKMLCVTNPPFFYAYQGE